MKSITSHRANEITMINDQWFSKKYSISAIYLKLKLYSSHDIKIVNNKFKLISWDCLYAFFISKNN